MLLVIDNNSSEWLVYLDLFIRCISYCRDSYIGLGERELSYILIYTLHEYFPRIATFLVCTFVHKVSENDNRLIGCWKDLPNLCQYIYNSSSLREKHPLISFCVVLMNDQLTSSQKFLYSSYFQFKSSIIFLMSAIFYLILPSNNLI